MVRLETGHQNGHHGIGFQGEKLFLGAMHGVRSLEDLTLAWAGGGREGGEGQGVSKDSL